MKIILLATHLDYGGIACYTVSLAKALEKRGHRVIVVTSGGDLVPDLDREHITHQRVNINTKCEIGVKVFLALRELFRIIKREKPDLLHAQTRVTQVIALVLSKLTKIPYVTTCHGFFKPRLFRILFPCWGHKVIAISEPVREHLVHEMKAKENDVCLIYNGIDTKKFSVFSFQFSEKKLKGEFGLKDGPVIGIIGRLSPVKGHRFLIAAMKEILSKQSEAQLLIVGDGKIKKDLINQAESLGIRDSVVFSQSVSDTRRALAVMDVFVLPSLQEGLGISILEAMAMRKPVVASSVGGIKTIVRHNENGLLVPSKDPTGLSQAILRLLEDPKLANEMGQNGQQLIEQKFSLDQMVEKVEKVYREVIKRND